VRNWYYIFDRHNRYQILADSLKYWEDKMKKYLLMLTMLPILITNIAHADPPQTAQKEWISQSLTKLKIFTPTEEMETQNIKNKPYMNDGYFIPGNGEVLIRFKDGSWVYVIMHNDHSDPLHPDMDPSNVDYRENSDKYMKDAAYREKIDKYRETYAIGNIGLSIDNKGNVYITNVHICDVQPFQGNNSIEDFRDAKLLSGKMWKKYNP
jgi:hypothetical protein